MLPIAKLDEDILAVDDDPSLSPEEKQTRIGALVASQREQAHTTGASIHYYSGTPDHGAADPLAVLAPIRVAIARRLAKSGPDGIAGSAGGLAKRIASTRLDDAISKDGATPKYPDEVLIIRSFGTKTVSHAQLAAAQAAGALTPALRQALLDVFDDVVETSAGLVEATLDNGVVLQRNIHREAREELGPRAFALMRPVLDRADFRVGLTGIVDDRYVTTPAWWKAAYREQGLFAYPCTATTVYAAIPPDLFDRLIAMTQTIEAGDGEVTGLTALPLTELLTRLSGAGHGNPGHDLDRHYRHTHEGLVPWKIACDLLGGDPDAMVRLAAAVRPGFAADNPLDFARVSAQTGLPLAEIDRQFGLPEGTFARMDRG